MVCTVQVHSSFETLPETAGWTILPADLINDAVISPRTEVIVLTCKDKKEMEREQCETCKVAE